MQTREFARSSQSRSGTASSNVHAALEDLVGAQRAGSAPHIARCGIRPTCSGPGDVTTQEPGTFERKLRTAGFTIAGAGLAALATGVVFGVLTITTNEAGKDKCVLGRSDQAADQFDSQTSRCVEGSSALEGANAKKDEARVFANVANVLVPLVLGPGRGAGRSRPAAGAARVLPSLGGVTIEGRF